MLRGRGERGRSQHRGDRGMLGRCRSQLGDGDAEHVGGSLQNRHSVDWHTAIGRV